jgi:hypothetical protein
MVARSARSRWSDNLAMARRSSCIGQWDPVEVGFVDLGHGRSNKFVREMRGRRIRILELEGSQDELKL